MLIRNHISVIVALLISFNLMAEPLTRQPTALQVARYMEPERLTFLCYCEYSGALSKLDTTGCETPGQRGVVGNIIPKGLIQSWIANGQSSAFIEETTDTIRNDPLNITIFNDTTYAAYQGARVFYGTMEPIGSFGACRFNIDSAGKAFIPDSRLGEVARTALYLSSRYHLTIPPEQKKSFEDIAAAMPVTSRERLRNKMAKRWNNSWNERVSPRPAETYYDRRLQEGLMDNIYQEHVLHNDRRLEVNFDE